MKSFLGHGSKEVRCIIGIFKKKVIVLAFIIYVIIGLFGVAAKLGSKSGIGNLLLSGAGGGTGNDESGGDNTDINTDVF